MLYHSAFMMPEGSRVHNTESSTWIQVPKYFESVRKYHYGSNYYIDDFREHRKVWETCTKQLNIQQKLLSLANNDIWRSRYTDLLEQHTHGRRHICSRETAPAIECLLIGICSLVYNGHGDRRHSSDNCYFGQHGDQWVGWRHKT